MSLTIKNAYGLYANKRFLLFLIRACSHFKNGHKNEINCRQSRKLVQIISGY